MPTGLRVWDAAGILVVDITDRLARILGVVDIEDLSVTDSRLTSGDIWASALVATPTYPLFKAHNNYSMALPPDFTLTGTTLSWDAGAFPGGTKIIYGLY